MSKCAYIGVENTARKVKSIYVGVDGVARKVKKAYVGDELGLARLCYSSEASFEDLMADMTLLTISGKESSFGAGTVIISNSNIPEGVFYILSFCKGEMGVYKGTRDSSTVSKTTLFQSGTNYGNVYIYSRGHGEYSLQYSHTGAKTTSVNGATLAIVQFPNHTEEEIDAVFSKLTAGTAAGRNSGGTATVSLALPSSGTYVFTAYNTYMAVNKSTGTDITNLYGNHTTNPSLLYVTSGTAYISTSGTASLNVSGASIVCVTA